MQDSRKEFYDKLQKQQDAGLEAYLQQSHALSYQITELLVPIFNEIFNPKSKFCFFEKQGRLKELSVMRYSDDGKFERIFDVHFSFALIPSFRFNFYRALDVYDCSLNLSTALGTNANSINQQIECITVALLLLQEKAITSPNAQELRAAMPGILADARQYINGTKPPDELLQKAKEILAKTATPAVPPDAAAVSASASNRANIKKLMRQQNLHAP